jgi:hypothetical protein
LAVEMSIRWWVACNAWGVGLKVENMPGARPRPAGRPLTSINKASTRRIQAVCFKVNGDERSWTRPQGRGNLSYGVID